MICKNCGTSLPDDSRFCTACGTPVQQEAPTPPPAQPQTPPVQTPPPPPPPQAPPVQTPPPAPPKPPKPPKPPRIPRPAGQKLITVDIAPDKLTLIFRITCAVLAGLFLLFSFYHIYIIFNAAISGVRGLLYAYSVGTSTAYVIIYRLLLLGASVTACVFLAIGGAAWKPSFNQKLMLGVGIAAGVRLLAALINFIRSFFVQLVRIKSGLGSYLITVMPLRLLYVLGYLSAGVVVFLFMYLLDCPPFIDKLKRNKSA